MRVGRMRDMGTTDEELLAAIRDGSRAAWGELFARHADTAWRTAFAIVRDHARAEDVVQDSFVRAIRAGSGSTGAGRFGPGCCGSSRTAPSTCSATSSSRRPARSSRPTARRRADDAIPPTSAARSRARPDRRAVVVLRYWLDLSPAEIADRMQVPVGTVASRLSRALDELAAYLEVTPNA